MKKLLTITLSLIISYSYAQWEEIAIDNFPNTEITSVYFIDQNNGWLVGKDWSTFDCSIWHSNDGGESWEIQYSRQEDMWDYFSDVIFIDELNGWVIGGNPNPNAQIHEYIYHTTNGGITWEMQQDGNENQGGRAYFTDLDNGWVVGSRSRILHTSDGGNSWDIQSVSGGEFLYDVFFIDNLTGWVVGGPGSDNNGCVYKTTDGGLNWVLKSTGNEYNFRSIYFINENLGWAVGVGGIIIHSVDGGENWTPQECEFEGNLNLIVLRDVQFISEEIGWIVGGDDQSPEQNLILYTLNGGESWEHYDDIFTSGLRSICFVDQNYGWCVGSRAILYTDNGGIVGIENSNSLISNLLINTHPNPFTTSTTLSYELQQPEKVILSIYNHLGQIVYQKQDNQPQGKQQLIWNAKTVPEGVYYYRLQVGDEVANGKMVKVR